MEMKIEEIIDFLRERNLKEISSIIGIPYDRMAKWVQGKAKPKLEDYNIVVAYIKNGKSSNKNKIGRKNTNDYQIPLIEQEAIAGYGNFETDIAEKDIIALYKIPEFNHVDFMIKIKGNSMYPKYSAGDTVACKILRDKTFIQWNKPHIIGTREQGIICKRLKPSQKKDCFSAVSDNKEYDPFDIPISEITGLALIIGVIRLE